ncbi:MAG: hypothetical protein AB7Q00_13400 [Phycisphaerales bacterium]
MADTRRNPHHATPADPTLALLDNLDRQLELLRELEGVARSQAPRFESSTPEELADLMARRQLIVDRLLELDARSKDLAPRECGEIDRRVSLITELLQAIRMADDESRERLSRRRDEVASELAELFQSRRATGAYGMRAAPISPNFQDRQA